MLPVALILFLQWPLRDFVRTWSREANDLGQWIFALYVSLAVTFATRERAHLAVDAVARGWPAPARPDRPLGRLRLRGAMGVVHDLDGMAHRSALGAGAGEVPDTFNPGYFLVKIAALLLAVLALLQALIDLRRRKG